MHNDAIFPHRRPIRNQIYPTDAFAGEPANKERPPGPGQPPRPAAPRWNGLHCSVRPAGAAPRGAAPRPRRGVAPPGAALRRAPGATGTHEVRSHRWGVSGFDSCCSETFRSFFASLFPVGPTKGLSSFRKTGTGTPAWVSTCIRTLK